MEKIDIAQQRGKSSHSAAAWKKETYWSIMEKGVIAQLSGKSSDSAAAWKKKT